jgi:hypothetical protein
MDFIEKIHNDGRDDGDWHWRLSTVYRHAKSVSVVFFKRLVIEGSDREYKVLLYS